MRRRNINPGEKDDDKEKDGKRRKRNSKSIKKKRLN